MFCYGDPCPTIRISRSRQVDALASCVITSLCLRSSHPVGFTSHLLQLFFIFGVCVFTWSLVRIFDLDYILQLLQLNVHNPCVQTSWLLRLSHLSQFESHLLHLFLILIFGVCFVTWTSVWSFVLDLLLQYLQLKVLIPCIQTSWFLRLSLLTGISSHLLQQFLLSEVCFVKGPLSYHLSLAYHCIHCSWTLVTSNLFSLMVNLCMTVQFSFVMFHMSTSVLSAFMVWLHMLVKLVLLWW